MPMSDAFRGVGQVLDDYRSLAEQTSALAGGGRATRRATPSVPAQQVRAIIRDAIDAFVKLPFTITVPGSHGRISNNELLGYLADGGRDFTAVTPQLRASIKSRLQQQFLGSSTIPLRIDFEATAIDVITEALTARFNGTLRDVRIKSLLAATIKKKRAAGYSNPALPGVATGHLAAAAGKPRVRW